MRALPDLYSKFVELVTYLVCITYIFLFERNWQEVCLSIKLENSWPSLLKEKPGPET